MFRFTIRDVLWLTVVSGLCSAEYGCSNRTSQKVEIVRHGIEAVDGHAKAIEQTADASASQKPSGDDN